MKMAELISQLTLSLRYDTFLLAATYFANFRKHNYHVTPVFSSYDNKKPTRKCEGTYTVTIRKPCQYKPNSERPCHKRVVEHKYVVALEY